MISRENSILIGEALTKLSQRFPDRFIVRMSDGGHNVMSANSEQNAAGADFTCPEQLGKVKSCADCGLCWTSKKSVKFLTHGAGDMNSSAINNGTTRFQKSIKPIRNVNVLKPGSDNIKLGGFVSAKKFNGFKIYQLTLIERETCPASCTHWRDCYGNGMPFSHRFRPGKELENRIEWELDHKRNEAMLIRLHVLGDFYSPEYVEFWGNMLANHQNVAVFGYTAHPINNDWRV
jgi:hypothetical protein